MITKTELEGWAQFKQLSLGNTEKDYLLDIILFSISKNTKNELVFKGGTCLAKFYQLPRFSEDLDFSATASIDVSKLIEAIIIDLAKFGINSWQHQKREPYNSILITLRLEGPLFAGKPMTYAKVGIDINLKSSVTLPPDLLTYRSAYPEVPLYTISCMKKEEIFAEKIRALLTRTKSRDLFDLHFLLGQGTTASVDLLQSKMEYYKEEFSLKKVLSRILEFQEVWDEEMKSLTTKNVSFQTVRKEVSKKMNEIYGEK